MSLYKVRPFHGQCVHSKLGLDQGRYLPEFHVDAVTPQEATAKAVNLFIQTHGLDKSQIEADASKGLITHILAYYDKNDIEIPATAYVQLTTEQGSDAAYYLCEYIDFNDVKRVK